MSSRRVTVAIPSLGRESLRATLRSLERQSVTPDEVLVINQGDPDLKLEFDLPLTVVPQPVRGVAGARNRALTEFRGDWVLFTDDDQEVSIDWVEQFHHLADHFQTADFFGGAVLPPLEYDRETMHMDQLYVLGDVPINRNSFLRPTVPVPYLQHDIWGGNYALSRRAAELQRYDECLGRGSTVFETGEDTDFNVRLLSAGLTGVLSARLIIYHTFGARPKSMANPHQGVELGAIVNWKAQQNGSGVDPEIAARLRPFGAKKSVLAKATLGALFGDHAENRQLFEKTWDRLDREFRLANGCLVKAES